MNRNRALPAAIDLRVGNGAASARLLGQPQNRASLMVSARRTKARLAGWRIRQVGLMLLASVLCLLSALMPRPVQASAQEPLLLTTTFPLYLITRNLTVGVEGVRVELMIPAGSGCPHDYTLTPQDMRKLAAADVLIINGLGLEDFLGSALRQVNPRLRVIDSSTGITELLPLDTASDPHQEHETEHEIHPASDAGHDHEAEHEDGGGAYNPHLSVSPRMSAHLAQTIADQLGQYDPSRAAAYATGAQGYGQRMQQLEAEITRLGQTLRTRRIVTQHGVFDYLARDLGLEVVAVVQAHAGQEPSAAELLALIQTVKERRAGAIFTEPQYPSAIAQTIAKETGIPIAALDPVATGPENAPLHYYDEVMRANLQTLEKILGRR